MVRKKFRPSKQLTENSQAASRVGSPSKSVLNYLELESHFKFDFCVTIHHSAEKPDYKLGEFTLFSDRSDTSFTTDILYLYVNDESKYLLYWKEKCEVNKAKVQYHLGTFNTPYNVLKSLNCKKHFLIYLNDNNFKTGILQFDIYISPNLVLSWNQTSKPVICNQLEVKIVMSHFFNIDHEEETSLHTINEMNIADIYQKMNNGYNPDKRCSDVLHNFLIPMLRPYQSQAVWWMLDQELQGTSSHGSHLNMLFMELNLCDGHKIYYNTYSGFFAMEIRELKPLCRGGILADEMGLGKTVEVLACILLNPRGKHHIGSMKIEQEVTPEKVQHQVSPQLQLQSVVKKTCKNSLQNVLLSENQKVNAYSSVICSSEANFINQRFECVCGYSEAMNSKEEISCQSCRLTQHAECVLNDPFISFDDYYCPYCHVDFMEPVASRATLIVSPSSIIYQWEDEISKHVKKESLKIFMYYGVSYHKFILPSVLADNDIVLTSYETFRKEVNYVDIVHNNSELRHNLRHPKKFMALPSPLIGVEWWRICLDEAQIVESVTSKTSEMALRLKAINRWCVTGTPINKSIEDLYGLLLFLRYEPFHEKFWWRELLLKPFAKGKSEFLIQIFNDILWRTPKKDILSQIGIPFQVTSVHWLHLSAIEKVFYEQKHLECSNEFLGRIEKHNCICTKLKSLDYLLLNSLMLPLCKLRQACCHPQVVRGEMVGGQSMLTMQELLAVLFKKAKRECEETHRQLVAAMNGLAGIFIIEENSSEAINMYTNVLQSIDEHSCYFRTDALQQIHTMHNCAEVLASQTLGKCIGSQMELKETMNDNSETSTNTIINVIENINLNDLRGNVAHLCETYLTKYRSSLKCSCDNVCQATEQVKDIEEQFKCSKHFPWWLKFTLSSEEEVIFISKVKSSLADGAKKFTLSFRNISGLHYIINHLVKEFEKSRLSLIKAMQEISLEPSEGDVLSAADCHLRPSHASRCSYCNVQDLFDVYESKLFNFDERNPDNVEESEAECIHFGRLRRGTWADGSLEIILKSFLLYFRHHNKDHKFTGFDDCIHDGNMHIKLFDAWKKEFKALRNLWMNLRDYVSSIDEIEMAKLRMQLLLPGEAVPDPPMTHIIPFAELQSSKFKLQSDIVCSQHELKKKLGHYFYLENLSKGESKESSQFQSQSCPVCQHQFGHLWSVLQCSHCLCVPCMHILVTDFSRGTRSDVRCPVCREVTPKSMIAYVDVERKNSDDGFLIKGSYSTKVISIVKCLLQIKKDDSSSKSLVFSTWLEFLYVLENALKENDIPFLSLRKKHNFQKVLKSFKNDQDLNILLLPFNAGAKGLNITEATHVLLAEPLIDNATVQQAVGRVHRIGQERVTTVHHFITRNTIEENIYKIQKGNEIESSMTVNDLRMLFEIPK